MDSQCTYIIYPYQRTRAIPNPCDDCMVGGSLGCHNSMSVLFNPRKPACSLATAPPLARGAGDVQKQIHSFILGIHPMEQIGTTNPRATKKNPSSRFLPIPFKTNTHLAPRSLHAAQVPVAAWWTTWRRRRFLRLHWMSRKPVLSPLCCVIRLPRKSRQRNQHQTRSRTRWGFTGILLGDQTNKLPQHMHMRTYYQLAVQI